MRRPRNKVNSCHSPQEHSLGPSGRREIPGIVLGLEKSELGHVPHRNERAQPLHGPAVWPGGETYCRNFLTCEMEIIMVPVS